MARLEDLGAGEDAGGLLNDGNLVPVGSAKNHRGEGNQGEFGVVAHIVVLTVPFYHPVKGV